MSIYIYKTDGSRTPWDPRTMGAATAGCSLCGGRIVAVGVFIPPTEAMHAVVRRLRQHPARPRSTPALGYGVCQFHLAQPDITDRIAAAKRVTEA